MAIPTEKLDVRYSDPQATAVGWDAALARLAEAELAWIVTVRPDGRPHATPMVPVVHGAKVYFHTGRHEVKFANLDADPRVLVLAGDTAWQRGLDLMVEGVASPVTDAAVLRSVAGRYLERWDGRWVLDVDGGVASATAPDAEIVVFEVAPTTVRAHAKGDPFGQTTYRFEAEASAS
jgi:general stress protein 26